MEKNKDKLIYKIVKSYYEKGLTQQEIANRYGLSRIKVSRIISKALEDKVIQIKITPPDNPFHQLEQQLEEKYGLKEVIISQASSEDKHILEDLGECAAEYFISRLQGDETICLSWGRTLLSFVNSIPVSHFPSVKVVQMIGGLGNPEVDTYGTDLTIRLAGLLSAKVRILNSPGIVKSKILCDSMMDELQIAETIKLAANADMAIIGIGSFSEQSVLLQENVIITREEAVGLISKGAIGDVGLRFFDANGLPVLSEIDTRVVGISIEQLKSIPRVIGIAGGKEKIGPIRAAIMGKYINVLITDENTANALLK